MTALRVPLRRRPAVGLLLLFSVPWLALSLAVLGLELAERPDAVALAVLLPFGSVLVLVAVMRALGARAELAPALAAFVWGASAITLIAGLANEAWGSVFAALLSGAEGGPWSRALAAGPIEEIYKLLGLGLIALAWRGSVSGPLRGLTLGMLVGLSFGTVEHIGFLSGWALDAGSSAEALHAVIVGFVARAFAAGLFLHAGFTGIAGLALGWALASTSRARWLVAAGGYVVAAALHSLANSGLIQGPALPAPAADLPMVVAVAAVRSVPFLVAIGALVVLTRRKAPATGR
jgi:hypothetical protein